MFIACMFQGAILLVEDGAVIAHQDDARKEELNILTINYTTFFITELKETFTCSTSVNI